MVKSALVLPAGTVTLVGTVVAQASLLERATTAPPAGASPLSITLPVEAVPADTVAGSTVTVAMWDHVMRPVALQVAPPSTLRYTPVLVPA
jgi:hypothetical protein